MSDIELTRDELIAAIETCYRRTAKATDRESTMHITKLRLCGKPLSAYPDEELRAWLPRLEAGAARDEAFRKRTDAFAKDVLGNFVGHIRDYERPRA